MSCFLHMKKTQTLTEARMGLGLEFQSHALPCYWGCHGNTWVGVAHAWRKRGCLHVTCFIGRGGGQWWGELPGWMPVGGPSSPLCQLPSLVTSRNILILCAEWINNKVLLYSTGSYIHHYPVRSHNGKEYEKEYIYMYVCMYNWFTLLYSRN